MCCWPTAERPAAGIGIDEFDPDWDHPMESVLMTHPEEVAPFMVRDFDLLEQRTDRHIRRAIDDYA